MHHLPRKKFGRLSTLFLPIKLPVPMVLQASFIRCAGRLLRMILWQPCWLCGVGNLAIFTCLILLISHFCQKKEDDDSVKDFRPISLVHSFAKLVTKLLANRLAGFMYQLVSLNQSAFIKGCFILDNFMLVQHTTKFLHQQKQPRVLMKLDITKAFNAVS